MYPENWEYENTSLLFRNLEISLFIVKLEPICYLCWCVSSQVLEITKLKFVISHLHFQGLFTKKKHK